jgi:glycosyltransferase involved in cell wall biosynthesis
MKISVVAGFARSHLLQTIRGLDECDALGIGVVPTGIQLSQNHPLRKFGIVNRAANRLFELNGLNIYNVNFPELGYQSGVLLDRFGREEISDKILKYSFERFSFTSQKILANRSSDGFLIRAGFGTKINRAKNFTVCDASLAHPLVNYSLTSGNGLKLANISEMSLIDQLIIADSDHADKILVNSNFVKETYLLAGVSEDKIRVAYLPPVAKLIEYSQKKYHAECGDAEKKTKRVVLFAGALGKRKGIRYFYELAHICQDLFADIEFRAIGTWSSDAVNIKKRFLSLGNAKWIPWVTHDEMAAHYIESDYFFFPTLSEGSARVLTEAMLFGLPVLTTNYSGAPIVDGHDGIICRANDSVDFIEKAIYILEDDNLSKQLGLNARKTVLEELTISKYISKVTSAFEDFS